MVPPGLLLLLALGGAATAAWLFVLFHPARPWDFKPVGDSQPVPGAPGQWPSVLILVPARNEAATLPLTLPALLGQDYPGGFRVVVVDDRSDDGTHRVLERFSSPRLLPVRGEPLPEGWVGKVWALAQGARGQPEPYLFLTDADILHEPGSLRRLVAESERDGLALNSRMARLHCDSWAERLLIPPFVWFFNLLYPMRRVNDPKSPKAAAAGGCVLVRRDALDQAGGFESIRGARIDDVALARRIKAPGSPIRLSLSGREVHSLRRYPTVGSIWKMVRRTAFTELGHSWIRLGGALGGLGVLFLAPPGVLFAGAGLALSDLRYAGAAALGLLSWLLMGVVFRPAPRFYGLGLAWTLSLPLAGALYAAMTLDSGLRGSRGDWR
jgi:hopene-associated glycosyltransferase HpnB